MAFKQIAATALTASDSTAKEEPGVVRVEATGKQYRYVRNCGSATLPKGAAVNLVMGSAAYYKVCASRVNTDSLRNGPKNAPGGLLVGSIRKGQYGWAQFRGNYLGTTARIQNGPGKSGVRVGLRSGQTSRLQALSSTALVIHTVNMGVIVGGGSTSFAKGLYLFG
jgi:hypothetical protein